LVLREEKLMFRGRLRDEVQKNTVTHSAYSIAISRARKFKPESAPRSQPLNLGNFENTFCKITWNFVVLGCYHYIFEVCAAGILLSSVPVLTLCRCFNPTLLFLP
jgi:hypothetical protein